MSMFVGAFLFVISSSTHGSASNTAESSMRTSLLHPLVDNVLTIDSGAGQTTCPNHPFAQPIVGHITDAFGDPVGGVLVRAVSLHPSVVFPADMQTTSSDGSYSFQAFGTVEGTANVFVERVGTTHRTALFQMTVADTFIVPVAGNGQVATFGTDFLEPLTVEVVDACLGPIEGAVVSFTSSSPDLTLSANSAVTGSNGRASITVSTVGIGAATVIATHADSTLTFNLFTRRLLVAQGGNSFIVSYRHEHPNVPLILAADAPGAASISTPYGTVATSILAPSPNFFALDGLGIVGVTDPTMITAPSGQFLRGFIVAPSVTGTFVLQMYGYDVAATYPFDYIVSNPVTVTF